MIKTFINRPILSTVISIILVLLGVLGFISLPVTQYPNIAPPTVNIRASYIGANAETVQKSVIIPIEEQVNGVEGMDYITSSAGNDGSASINVFFKQINFFQFVVYFFRFFKSTSFHNVNLFLKLFITVLFNKPIKILYTNFCTCGRPPIESTTSVCSKAHCCNLK